MSKVKFIPTYFLILGLLFASVSGCANNHSQGGEGESTTGADTAEALEEPESDGEAAEDLSNNCLDESDLQQFLNCSNSEFNTLVNLEPNQLKADFYKNSLEKIEQFETNYQTFKTNNSAGIDTQNFAKLDTKINDSIRRNNEIFSLLASDPLTNEKIQQAQTILSKIVFDSQPLYQFSEEEQQKGIPDGEDGQGTRLAAQKLLSSLTKNLSESSSQLSNLSGVGSGTEKSSEETTAQNPEVSTVTQATGSANASGEKEGEKVSTFWDINFLDLLLSIIGLIGLVLLVLLWRSRSNSLTIKGDSNDPNNKEIVKDVLNKVGVLSNTLAEINKEIQAIQKDKSNNLDNEKLDSFINELGEVREAANELIIGSLSQINSSKYTTESNNNITDGISNINYEIQSIKSLIEEYRSSVLDDHKLDQLSQSFNQISKSFDDVSSNLNLLQARMPKKEVLTNEITKIQNLLNSLANNQNSAEERQKSIELEQQLKQKQEENQKLIQVNQQLRQNNPNINLQNQIKELEAQLKARLDEEQQYLSFMYQDEEREKENLQLNHKISELESEIQKFKNELDKERQKFNFARQTLESEKSNLEQENSRLQKQVTELTSKAKSSKSKSLPNDIFNLVMTFRQEPGRLLSQASDRFKIDQVSEMEESATDRRENNSSAVFLKTPDTGIGDFWLVSSTEKKVSYLFPKDNKINPSLKRTAKALFDGYKLGNTDKFILDKPAKVSHIVTSRQWKLEEKGELNYEI